MRSGLISLVVLVLGVVALAAVFDVPLNDPVWWLSNEAPPAINVSGPSGVVRGSVEAHIGLEPATRSRIVSIRVDDQQRSASDGRLTLDTAQMADGTHRVEVVAHDTSRRQNLANTLWTFVSDNTGPALDVSLDPSEGPLEGHTMVVRVKADEPMQDVRGTVDGRTLRLQPGPNGTFWAVLGIPPDPPSAELSVTVAASDALGNPSEAHKQWAVRRTTFPEDDLTLEPSQSDLEAHQAEDRQLGEIYAQPNGGKRWDGAFRAPVAGAVTTAFGTHRSYEYHPGMDFGVAQGTPVAAPANAVVAWVGTVPARGNVVILDHGAGVYSTYAHLEKAEVAAGVTVKPGQTIARVGTTGFSTGPHLHWEIWVDGANVDPLEWTRRAFP